ncbi:MAG: flavin reductase family protein [Paracoccus sp. (in: a-proteobacteria)]|uniref:flavin reductase family protein n=1 Tax=Paracoccus sp. TaxID=267 RepID=UPI0026E03ADF|nr:flavin reductase family protein [Paracoccus sp. (in: a-proteobacteria)]MDO5622881.1 flavin reductase family protein [Paracoccus sp. (in: a-proteobacteria)]
MSDLTPLKTFDARAFRDCCGSFATGVTVITTRSAEGDHGATVSAFMSVSLDPPLICISLDRRTKMLKKIEASGRYAVNILATGMQAHALHFAGRRYENLTDLFMEHDGLPVLRNAAAIMVANVVQQVEAGDHVLLIGHVQHLERDPVANPLLYHAGTFGNLAVNVAE